MSYLHKLAIITGSCLGLLSMAPGHALVITPDKTNSSETIVDGATDTRSVSFAIGDLSGALNRVKDVNITIEFMKCASADGTLGLPLPAACPQDDPTLPQSAASANEIRFLLTNPGSTSVILVDAGTYDSTGAGSRVTVTFDDAAANAVGGDPTTGLFQPFGLLSAFNGGGVLGTWDLLIEDTVGTDPLGFAFFTLNISVCDVGDTDPACQRTSAIPVPATPLLLGFGLLGLAGWRRRRR